MKNVTEPKVLKQTSEGVQPLLKVISRLGYAVRGQQLIIDNFRVFKKF